MNLTHFVLLVISVWAISVAPILCFVLACFLVEYKEPFRLLIRDVLCAYCQCFGKDHLCACGHNTKRWSLISIPELGTFTCKNGSKAKYCSHCLNEKRIRCAFTGAAIFPGDAVCLHAPQDNFDIPEYAVFFSQNPMLLVAHLGYRPQKQIDGFWTPECKVELYVPEPVELLKELMPLELCFPGISRKYISQMVYLYTLHLSKVLGMQNFPLTELEDDPDDF
jgi:hypothetical protein